MEKASFFPPFLLHSLYPFLFLSSEEGKRREGREGLDVRVTRTAAGEGVRRDSSLNSQNNVLSLTRSLFFFFYFFITFYLVDSVLGCAQLVGRSRRYSIYLYVVRCRTPCVLFVCFFSVLAINCLGCIFDFLSLDYVL